MIRDVRVLPFIETAVRDSFVIDGKSQDGAGAFLDHILEVLALLGDWPQVREMLRLQGFDADAHREAWGYLLHHAYERRMMAEAARAGTPVPFDNPSG